MSANLDPLIEDKSLKINGNFKYFFSQDELDQGIEQTNKEIINLLNFKKQHRNQIAYIPPKLLPKKPKIAFRFFQKACADKMQDKIGNIGKFIKDVAVEWKGMTQLEQEIYHKSARDDQIRYLKQLKSVVENTKPQNSILGKRSRPDPTRPQPFDCNQCGKKFSTKNSLSAHMSHYHPKQEPNLTCYRCLKTYRTIDNLRFHKKNHCH